MNNAKIRLHNPLWIHIPAVAMIVLLIMQILKAIISLHGPVPVHFAWDGHPDRFGQVWEVGLAMIAASIFMVGISTLIDELWARQETKKTLNWMTFFDEIIVALLVGIGLSYYRTLMAQQFDLTISIAIVVLLMLVSMLAALRLEQLRPWMPTLATITHEDTTTLQKMIARRLKDGDALAYIETQCPAWMNPLAIALALFEFTFAIILWPQSPWISLTMVLTGLIFIILYGGLIVAVTPTRLTVRLGIVGLPLLRLPIAEIAAVDVHNFSPLKDFGGYGIRFNKEMVAYFLRGATGVKVTTAAGKKYLIGSDHPERLAAVLQTIQSPPK